LKPQPLLSIILSEDDKESIEPGYNEDKDQLEEAREITTNQVF
jgi:hypothetical protein